MQDRFKFRAVLHQNKYEEYRLEKFSHQRVFDVMSINLGIEYSTIEIVAEYPNGDWAVREIDDKDIDLIQSTGLKDKNGKLIYEGDIINIWCKNFTKNQISEVKFCKERAAFTFDYNTDFGNIVPCTMEKTEIEVIGNIYENPELLEAENILEQYI